LCEMMRSLGRQVRQLRSHMSTTATTTVKQAIDATEFAQRRANLVTKLRRATPGSRAKPLAVVMRSATRQFSAPDVPYPFRQCSYFRYFTGLTQPDAVLLIVAERRSKPISVLYIEERSEKQELWEGPVLSASEIADICAVEEIKGRNQLMLDLQMLICGAVIVSYDDTTLNAVLSGCAEVVPLREHIDSLRWIKSPAEQTLMRETCRIGAQAFNAMISRCKGVANENEIVGRLELEVRRRGAACLSYPPVRRRGAACLSYPPVVAAANRANTIHYLDANQAINDGDTVLVDAGCDYEGYTSDITRVFPVSGYFSAPQRALYDALNDVQSRLLNYLKQTELLRLNEVYTAMIEYLAKNLVEIGLFSDSLDKDELVHETDKICPHHVSHYLGMDVHDTGSVSRKIPLQRGVVFTVEPGMFIVQTH
uniref:AMP_N domain-containing protein n=1 Tax=Gongylonema pulchrum TaxID=637853 RepID=A0A183DY52_9BILA